MDTEKVLMGLRGTGILLVLLAVVALALLVAGAPPNRFHTADVTRTVFASAARTASANSTDFEIDPTLFKGTLYFLDVSSASGTLDVALQRKDPVSANYATIPGASFPQVTAEGTHMLVLYPGIGETVNEAVSEVGSGTLRAVAALGNGPSFTFTLAAVPVQ